MEVKEYVPPRTTLVGRDEPDELSSSSPGYPPRTHGVGDVLLRATVVSMVPAAPLLPMTDPWRRAVVHRAVPGDVVAAPPVDEVVADVPRVEVVDAEVVEVEVDGLDEHAPSIAPDRASAATRPQRYLMLALLWSGDSTGAGKRRRAVVR
jgi:hypothetical protein